MTLQELQDTPFTFVDTPAQLAAMADHLQASTEVAVDLEHHQYRSFQGFTCLVQISSRSEDFVVDPLALRGHLGAALTPIFANPSVRHAISDCCQQANTYAACLKPR